MFKKDQLDDLAHVPGLSRPSLSSFFFFHKFFYGRRPGDEASIHLLPSPFHTQHMKNYECSKQGSLYKAMVECSLMPN